MKKRNCQERLASALFPEGTAIMFVSVSVVLFLRQRKSLQEKYVDTSLLSIQDLYCIGLYHSKELSVMNEVLKSVKWLVGLHW
jgi:hypothetical protein